MQIIMSMEEYEDLRRGSAEENIQLKREIFKLKEENEILKSRLAIYEMKPNQTMKQIFRQATDEEGFNF